MSESITRQPDNFNFLSELGHKFLLKRAPNTVFFVQEVSVPALNLAPVFFPNMGVKFPRAGDHLEYGELLLTFRVDEELVNYMELHNWMRGLGFPETHAEYKALADKPIMSGEGIDADATIYIKKSTMNPNIAISFQNIFPTSLSNLQFTTMSSDVQHISCDASFSYLKFDIETNFS